MPAVNKYRFMKQWYNKKRIVFVIIASLIACLWWMYLTGSLICFIEKIKNETPEAKVAAYIQAVAENNKEKALSFWDISESYELNLEYCNEIRDLGKQVTKKLIEKKIKSDFTITHIEWWSTCCVPRIIENPCVAGEAKVYVQLTDSNNAKSIYIFDVIVPGGYDGGLSGHSVRHWVISDIYLEDQESFLEVLEKETKHKEEQEYKNDKYGYEIQYFENEVEIVLNEFIERGTEGNPGFRIKTGGHFAVGVWDNPKNLTARQWIDEQYLEYSGGWFGEFEEIVVGKEKAYSALTTEPCYIEWIIIPKSNRFYTFGVELCDENIEDSLSIFKSVVDSFKFVL